MKRKEFLRKGFGGLASLFAFPTVLASCESIETTGNSACPVSPSETKGPFPIKSPSELVRANIVSDREGLALVVDLTIQDSSNNCAPLAGAIVDIWHCDKDGNYSEYGGMRMQQADFTGAHFLRGRQTADKDGKVSFVTIYPGWYPGRAPHIHIEVLSAEGRSLRATQVAFPEDISKAVYESTLYVSHGQADTSNSWDGIFSNSLERNMASVTGSAEKGYTLKKTLTV